MKNYEDLYNHIKNNTWTGDACAFECEVSDWSIDWSGYNSLEIQVEADTIDVNNIEGHDLCELIITTRYNLESILRNYEPETSEEECVTADDIRKGLDEYRVLYQSWGKLSEVDHDEIIQNILTVASQRKAGAC